MKELLLFLDFFCPVLFFFLGRSLGKRAGRVLVKESLLVLFSAVLFSPAAYLYTSLAVQGACTAVLMLLQFALTGYSLYKEKILL